MIPLFAAAIFMSVVGLSVSVDAKAKQTHEEQYYRAIETPKPVAITADRPGILPSTTIEPALPDAPSPEATKADLPPIEPTQDHHSIDGISGDHLKRVEIEYYPANPAFAE